MNNPASDTLSKLQPTELWKHFQELCNRPHPSKNEQAVVDYVLAFAQARGLPARQDEVGNVIISKPATAGMEDRRGVILQSHLDMVPQKNSGTDHDFDTDPIRPVIDGDWVRAEGTTLGADNGIGVAAILAALESGTIPHGPLEALLTIDEEAGMTGANGLQPGELQGDMLLNLDSEDEGELFVGCAGGIDVNVTLPYRSEAMPADSAAFELAVIDLKGGHSGCDIHLGRGNANVITNRLLDKALARFAVGVSEFRGGTLRNAIPREAFTTVSVPASEAALFETFVTGFEAAMRAEFGELEPDLKIHLKPVEIPAARMAAEDLRRFVKAVAACPNGVARMIPALPDVVETSSNLALVFNENGNMHVQCLVRSSVESASQDRCRAIAAAFELPGAEVVFANGYPGWEPDMDSPLLALMRARHVELFGAEAAVKVIHAGLECGILGATYPHWDMISFGPTIRAAHSPDEKVHVPAVANFWTYLKAVLADTPKRT